MQKNAEILKNISCLNSTKYVILKKDSDIKEMFKTILKNAIDIHYSIINEFLKMYRITKNMYKHYSDAQLDKIIYIDFDANGDIKSFHIALMGMYGDVFVCKGGKWYLPNILRCNGKGLLFDTYIDGYLYTEISQESLNIFSNINTTYEPG